MLSSNKQCPVCASLGRDKDKNNLFLMANGKGYVCRQNRITHPPYYEWFDSTESHKEQEFNMDVESIKKLLYKNLPDRKINKSVCEFYGVTVGVDETNGEVDTHFYPITKKGQLTGYKVRSLPKTFSVAGDGKGAIDLFGQSVAPQSGKRLLITGGELDCLAAFQMLHAKYPQYTPAVVSLPKGENTSAVKDNLGFIKSFDEVIIYTDMDDPGRKCAEQICRLIGPKAKVVSTSEKDASDMLKLGKQTEFISAYFSAKEWRPPELLIVEDVYDEAVSLPSFGRPWPWPSLTKLTYGRRDGEGIYVGAGVKVGKTEWLSQMVDYIIQAEGKPVFLAKFEQSPGQTLKAIAGKRDRKQYHNPESLSNGQFTQEDLNNAINLLKDKVYLFNAGYSDAGQGDLWERIKSALRYVVLVKGVKDVFIDPITQLTDGMTPSDTETYLRKFSNEIQALAQELGFFYYCFCHLKEPTDGKPHEEGGKVKSAQFRGSRAMQEKTKFMLGIERNILAEDEEERNKSTFKLLLNSGFGKPGVFPVVYNPDTTEYLEPRISLSSGDY